MKNNKKMFINEDEKLNQKKFTISGILKDKYLIFNFNIFKKCPKL